MARFDTNALRADNPLSRYLPTRGLALKPDGREWRCLCPFHSERTPSFQIYQGRNGIEQFKCQGCGESGDVIGFVEKFDGVSFDEACAILGGERETSNERRALPPPEPAPDVYAEWRVKIPPASAPPIVAGQRTPQLANPKRGNTTTYVPDAVYPYRLADGRVIGYVLRVIIGGKKITPLVLYCHKAGTDTLMWCHRPFPGARRLYNLPAFTADPAAPVLVVEGEKCAEAAIRLLPEYVATCWQGGAKAAAKSDWSPVSGRDVLIWPDADPEGLSAAQEAASLAQAAGARRVQIIAPPAGKAKGWDLADAEAEGWTKADVIAHARAQAQEAGEQSHERPRSEPEPPEDDERRFDVPPADRDGERNSGETTAPALKPASQEKPQAEPEHKAEPRPRPNLRLVTDSGEHWMRHLEFNQNGAAVKKIMKNVIGYLQHHPDMSGCIAKNVFSSEIMLMRRPPWDHEGEGWTPRAMIDADVISAVAWLDGPRLDTNKGAVTDAVLRIAHENRFDPVREYLDSLKWDGVYRLMPQDGRPGWLTRYLGVKPTRTGIEAVFGFRWMIAAIARNRTTNPSGAKVDNMLVIEGRQGLKKSTALETLATLGGNRWFTSGVEDVRSKDGKMQMQGCLIVEMDELAALGKTDVEKVKSFISTQQDDIRPPYGRGIVKIPRRFVLAGTMNPRGMGYLPDSTGNRRFWPVLAETVADIEALERDRDQLWAEADQHYQGGEPWWLQGDEVQHAEAEQRKRFQADPWADDLDDWLGTLAGEDPFVTLKQAFQVLSIPIHQRTSEAQSRIVNHLTQAGWVRATVLEDGRKKLAFRRRK